ncbi:MAG: hypothetical protein IKK66_04670 [Ruminococcus sp.]|nr:hypothetical protein [Ruminococcus sp.]
MKYVVMQCCKGYAVLMDEESKFVFAANQGFEVGQIIINPVIMTNDRNDNRNITAVIKVIAAAAACVAIITGMGYSYYAQNLKTYSVVTITSDSAISMELNKTGKVIRLTSDTDYGKEIIEKTDIKGMDKLTAANEILQTEISDGHISNGDTVDVYVSGSDTAKTDSLRTELENELPKLDLKVNIHDGKAGKHDKVKTPEKDKDIPLHEKNKAENIKDNKNDKAPAPPVTTATAPAHKHDEVKPAVSEPAAAPVPPVNADKESLNDKKEPQGNPVPDEVVPPVADIPLIEGEKPVPPQAPDMNEKPAKHDKDDTGNEKPVLPHHNREAAEGNAEVPLKEQVHKELPKTDFVKKEDI